MYASVEILRCSCNHIIYCDARLIPLGFSSYLCFFEKYTEGLKGEQIELHALILIFFSLSCFSMVIVVVKLNC